MKKKKYGRTDLMISELCLSAGRIDRIKDRSVAYGMLDMYSDYGGNFIQASSQANLSGVAEDLMSSPSLVGNWLNANPGSRDRIILSARIRCPKGVVGLELEGTIRLQVEETLKRYGTRYLDVALLDWSAESHPSYEAMAAVERLSDAGLLRYVGSSGFPCWRIAEWLGRGGAQASRMRLESVHLDGPFTQCCLEDLANEYRVSLVVRWPYPNSYSPLFKTAPDIFGNSSFQMGVAWLLSRPSITSVLLGPSSQAELSEALRAADADISFADLSLIEAAYMQCAIPVACPQSEAIELES